MIGWVAKATLDADGVGVGVGGSETISLAFINGWSPAEPVGQDLQ